MQYRVKKCRKEVAQFLASSPIFCKFLQLKTNSSLSLFSKSGYNPFCEAKRCQVENLALMSKGTMVFFQKSDVPKSCRRPHNLSLAISADASILDESKCYEDSNDCDKSGKLSGNLRQPHGPSPGLSFKANGNESVEKTLFDRQLEDYSKADSEFYVLNKSSQSPDKKMQQKSFSPKPAKPPTAVVIPEMSEIPKVEIIEVKEIFLQDGAACLPPKITSPSETDDEVAKLTEQLASVETKQRLLDQQRAELLQKISKNSMKNRTNDNFQANKENFSHNCNQQNNFTGINRKCAATFGTPKKQENPPKIGFGRGGIPFDFEALEKWKPIGIRGNQQDSATTDSSDVKKDQLMG